MKSLRIFVSDNLEAEVQWCLLEHDNVIDTGSSSLDEIAAFESMPLEVYLSPASCSIFKLNVAGINTKNLTDELVLGLLEDNLTDDIDDIKPIIISLEDEIIYVAVFNSSYFERLMANIYSLDKPIRFIQSFVYATIFNDKSWTVFLNKEYSFVRTSKYQYYLLDDNKPVPSILMHMLLKKDDLPESLLIYNVANEDISSLVDDVGLNTEIINEKYFYGAFVWNFYNLKSSSFNFKFDINVKAELLKLLYVGKYFFACLFLFWLIQVATLEVSNLRLDTQLHKILHSEGNQASRVKLDNLRIEISKSEHERGLYSDNDAITLLRKFLQIVSNIDENTITAMDYSDHKLRIFVNDNFQADEFSNYRNILNINHVDVVIDNYKEYARAQKKANKNSTDSSNTGSDLKVSDNTAWVITLQSSSQE